LASELTSQEVEILQVQLRVNVAVENIETTDAVEIRGYNGNGIGNPESDAASVAYAACISGTPYVTITTEFQTVGVKTVDLGAQAVIDLQAILDAAGTTFALGFVPVYNADFEVVEFESEDEALSSPPAFIIDYNVVETGNPVIMRRRIEGY
jgi:hypothetical protein